MVVERADLATIDPYTSRLRLREELLFVPQRYRNRTYYHIEVPSSSEFYRIGFAEYFFISLLDGNTTFAEALALTAQKLGADSLTQQKAIAVFHWLLENQLADLITQSTDRPPQTVRKNRSGGILQRANPFWMKIPLIRPDRIVHHLEKSIGFLFSFSAFLISALLFLIAITTVASHWDRFLETSETVFSPSNWAWLLISWLLLKVVHEFAHGIVCKRYGGDVREMGIVLILFAPLAYVDVTSTWRFSSKWKRIHVALAGIYAELSIASVAAIVWARTDSDLLAYWLFNLIFMASVSTLVCNANPLMRFDGYYVLADALEIPNLYAEGSQFVGKLARWIFFAESIDRPQRLGSYWWLVRIYGIMAFLWRGIICASLLLIAAAMFRGAGVVLAIFGVALWFLIPCQRLCRELFRRFSEDRLSFVRATIVSLCMAGFFVTSYHLLPTPTLVNAPGIVEYADLEKVRVVSSGFIKKIHVQNGQVVEPGAVLLEIENIELRNEFADLQHQLEQSRIKYDICLDKHSSAQAQIERQQMDTIQERLMQLEPEIQGLTVTAPAAGKVIARNLQQRIGSYVKQGEELMSIGNESRKEFVVSIGQRDVDSVLPQVGESVCLRIGSRSLLYGKLSKVEPRASSHVPHPALAATMGGALTVHENSNVETQSQDKLQLTEPRFKASVAINSNPATIIFAGERGQALIRWRTESIGQTIRFHVEKWFRSRT